MSRFTIHFLILICCSLGRAAIPQDPTPTAFSKTVLGFPFEAWRDRELICYASQSRHVVRFATYRIDRAFFTRDNLERFFGWASGFYTTEKELRIIVLADRDEMEWFSRNWVGGVPEGSDHEFERGLSRSRSSPLAVAEFYRSGENEAFWYELIDAIGPTRVVMKGHDPYQPVRVKIPMSVVKNDLTVDETGVECYERQIDVLIRGCDFSKPNLTMLFASLAEQFPAPERLRVYATAHVNSVERELRQSSSIRWVYSLRLRDPRALPICEQGMAAQVSDKYALYTRSNTNSAYGYHDFERGEHSDRIVVPLSR